MEVQRQEQIQLHKENMQKMTEILRFLQEYSISFHPDLAELFGLFSPVYQASPMDSVFEADGTCLYYSDSLTDHFITDSTAVKSAYLDLHLQVLAKFWEQHPPVRSPSFAETITGLVPWTEKHLKKRIISDPARATQSLTKIKSTLSDQESSAGGSRGKGAGSRVDEVTLEQKKTIDYRTFLRQFTRMGEEAILDMDSFDMIPYYYGMANYDRTAFLEPLEYSEVNRLDELAIAIDTSGSCSGAIVQRFLEETWSILRTKENFFSKMRLHLIQCDSVIQDYRIIENLEAFEEMMKDLKVIGHGNTDFCPVFDLLNQKIKEKEIRHLRALLYFTDGDGIFPYTPPVYDTAFVFLNHETEKQKIPSWGIRLNLELPEDFSIQY